MNEIKMETESFKRAMAKAIENKPMARVGKKTGQYFVAASDGFSSYPVVFSVGGGRRVCARAGRKVCSAITKPPRCWFIRLTFGAAGGCPPRRACNGQVPTQCGRMFKKTCGR